MKYFGYSESQNEVGGATDALNETIATIKSIYSAIDMLGADLDSAALEDELNSFDTAIDDLSGIARDLEMVNIDHELEQLVEEALDECQIDVTASSILRCIEDFRYSFKYKDREPTDEELAEYLADFADWSLKT